MQISSLEKMESIVENHPNLRWNGWTVEYTELNKNAMFKTNGIFTNDAWYTKQSFQIENGSWNIPDSILRKGNVQI